MKRIRPGLELALERGGEVFAGRRVGLICNHSSVDGGFRHAADLFAAHPEIDLRAVYGPQHGIRGETQDNMIEWEGFVDPRTGITAYSLYGRVRKPAPEMLADVDLLVFDVQDVGTRVYTFIYTMALAMEAARESGKSVMVLDRPNPITCNKIEGSLLEPGTESFVGMYPIPMRHGMTVGELARLFNSGFGIGCDLTVVPMEGYNRGMWFDETGAPWVLPSPNMPTLETAVVYPGTVYVEGTKLSEGRGTTRPFELIGAPYADSYDLAGLLNGFDLPGAYFRPHSFQPTFQKEAGRLCHGVQIHVTDREAFHPVITGIAVIKAFHDLYPEEFRWQDAPYEYVFDRPAFDVIAGGSTLREQIERGASVAEIAASWEADEAKFAEMRAPHLLY